MSRDELRFRESGILGYYLGLSDYVRMSATHGLPIDWPHIAKRMMELRIEHDQLHEGGKNATKQ